MTESLKDVAKKLADPSQSQTHNVTREELTRIIAKKTGNDQATTHSVISALLDEIVEQFHAGNPIELRGFGTFYPYFKGARSYIIPRLKEQRVIKGRTTLKFKPSKQILVYKD